MLRHSLSKVLSAALVSIALLSNGADAGREEILADGKDEYSWNCKACHGDDGKGLGDMAKILVKTPADLTGIAARNDGKFPFWRIFEIIAGETPVAGHQTFQMPNFWRQFHHQEGKRGFGPADQRIISIVLYLQSIQKQ